MTKILRILGRRGRITIPYKIRERMGFAYNDVLSFTEAKDGRTIIVRREKICDSCSEHAPKNFEKRKDLEDFLDNLSTEQQSKALIYLSEKWAGQKGGASND